MSGVLHPRENPRLFGHAAAEAALTDAWRSARMPHAWLISGARGTGKATLCYRFARMALAGADAPLAESHPVFRRVAAGAHADLLTIEPKFDEKKEETKREIGIEQAREIGAFLTLTPAEARVRIAIVDSADELTIAAANAILKTVEEPPPGALLLLVSHNPGALLPTIRSRCRLLRLPPMPPDAFGQAMRELAPEDTETDNAALGALSGYAPGAALVLLAQEGLALHMEITNIFQALPAVPPVRVLALADRILAAKGHVRWETISNLMLRLMALAAGAGGEPLPNEGAALDAMRRLHPPAAWASRHAEAAQQFSLAARVHLDYKSVLVAFFHALPQPMTVPIVSWNRAISI